MSWFVIVDVLLTGRDKNLLSRCLYLMYHMDTGLWFLWVLFILSILGLLLEMVRQKGYLPRLERLIMGQLIILYLAIAVSIAKLSGTLAFLGIKYVLYYSIFYLIGYLLQYLFDKSARLSKTLLSKASVFTLLIFLGIVFNYNLYESEEDILSIALRCIAGICGTTALLHIVSHYDSLLRRYKINRLGQYSLELYVTHIHICHLLNHNKAVTLFSMEGVMSFLISFSITMLLTVLIIKIIHAFPSLSFLFYGSTKHDYR